MNKPWQIVKDSDLELYTLIESERARQNDGIELIASENFASAPVIASMGSILTNKYAEGLPGKRYYGGCVNVDQIEALAIKRATELFGCSFANVQPHSGANANLAALLALAEPGDTILGLDLTHGGHLTHGSSVNFSGKLFKSHFYHLDPETETLNYENILKTAEAVRPKVIIAGASAYPRIIDFEKFKEIADKVGAYLLVDMAHIAGLVATKHHPSPFPHAHVVTTTTHKTLRGPRGGIILWNDPLLSAQLNKSVFPGTQGGPLEHIIAAKALSFKEASSDSFRHYQLQVIKNAQCLAHSLIEKGFKLVSGGTDNHLMLIDLSSTKLSGKEYESVLESISITTNKNTVPNEKRSPFVTSGLRIGTPAVTSRGMKEVEMIEIAYIMHEALKNHSDQEALTHLKNKVKALCQKYPVYPFWA
jgi:glycine hydroxymethyltransferase